MHRQDMKLSRLDAKIFLISFAFLLFQLLLTRIFSVTMFHHLTFLAVSLAMMGLGASGMRVTLRALAFPPERLAALGSALAVLIAMSFGFGPYFMAFLAALATGLMSNAAVTPADATAPTAGSALGAAG